MITPDVAKILLHAELPVLNHRSIVKTLLSMHEALVTHWGTGDPPARALLEAVKHQNKDSKDWTVEHLEAAVSLYHEHLTRIVEREQHIAKHIRGVLVSELIDTLAPPIESVEE